jgi:hypothetical protein
MYDWLLCWGYNGGCDDDDEGGGGGGGGGVSFFNPKQQLTHVVRISSNLWMISFVLMSEFCMDKNTNAQINVLLMTSIIPKIYV